MKYLAFFVVSLLPFFGAVGFFSPDLSSTLADAGKSVVTLHCRIDTSVTIDPKKPPSETLTSGSGVIIDSSGIILTNDHVVGKKKCYAVGPDTNLYPATVLGQDDRVDLAVLKIKYPSPLRPMPFSSSELKVGEQVYTIGAPDALYGTISDGIVSALHRDIEEDPYDDLIQATAEIHPGNSGGALINRKGELVGITQMIWIEDNRYAASGISFSIPLSTVIDVLPYLEQGKPVLRSFIGVEASNINFNTFTEHPSINNLNGSYVEKVIPNGPAEKAGMKVGDVIKAFDNISIGQDQTGFLRKLIVGTKPTKTVKVDVLRNGKLMTLNVTADHLQ